MGTTQAAIVIALVAHAAPARAESCTGVSAAGKFATCFDPGNRLSITAGSDGFGLSLALRHIIRFEDEPDLVWKLDHTIVSAKHAGFADRFAFSLYRGHFIRHARDGHIVIPIGEPKKVFLPFDVGAFAEAGTIEWRDEPVTRIGVVKVAGLVDFARVRDFTRRIAIGPLARWDVDMTQEPRGVRAHLVTPFTAGLANLHLETDNGRTIGDLRIEAGTVWHSDAGWEPQALAEATIERILLAINDRPISLVVGARYTTENNEASARVGARFTLFDRRDPRVSLTPTPKVAPPKPAPPPKPTVDPWQSTLPSPAAEPTQEPTEPAQEPNEPSVVPVSPPETSL